MLSQNASAALFSRAVWVSHLTITHATVISSDEAAAPRLSPCSYDMVSASSWSADARSSDAVS